MNFNPKFSETGKFLFKNSSQHGQSSSHAAVINITAHLDSHSTDQRRVERKRCVHPRPISALEIRQDARLKSSRQRSGALDFRRVPQALEFQQASEVSEQCESATAFGLQDFSHCLSNPRLVQHSSDHAQAEQLLGLALELFGLLHFLIPLALCGQVPGRFFV